MKLESGWQEEYYCGAEEKSRCNSKACSVNMAEYEWAEEYVFLAEYVCLDFRGDSVQEVLVRDDARL